MKYMHTLEYSGHQHIDDHKFKMEILSDVNLETILSSIEVYLRAVGYVFDGHLEIVQDEN